MVQRVPGRDSRPARFGVDANYDAVFMMRVSFSQAKNSWAVKKEIFFSGNMEQTIKTLVRQNTQTREPSK